MFSKTTPKLLRAFWRVVTSRGLVGELLPLKTQRAADRIQFFKSIKEKRAEQKKCKTTVTTDFLPAKQVR